jgi:hypothetical protein
MKKFNDYKYCWDCGCVLPVSMFSYNMHKDDGLRDQCKDCFNAYKVKYDKTINGKISNGKSSSKSRGLKFTPLMSNPFPEEVEVDWHHVNDLLVIPIPRKLHRGTRGKDHIAKCNMIIDDLYGLDIDRLLGSGVRPAVLCSKNKR